jgi:hypothetical protein
LKFQLGFQIWVVTYFIQTLKGRLAVKKLGSVLLMVAVVCAMGGIVGCPSTPTPKPPAADASKKTDDTKKADDAKADKK